MALIPRSLGLVACMLLYRAQWRLAGASQFFGALCIHMHLVNEVWEPDEGYTQA